MATWINTVSRDHVRIGLEGGFTQANHGRPTTLRRLARGDLIAYYSPRTSYPDGVQLRRFTALARVLDDEPYQAEMTPDFHPWRRRVEAIPGNEADIGPLVDALGFIRNKRSWGFVFRRGLFRIPEEDFRRIAAAMVARLTERPG